MILLFIIVGILLTFGLGLFTLLSKPNSKTNQWFFAFTLFSSAWIWVNYLSVNTFNENLTKIYIEIVLFVTIWMQYSFINFTRNYPKEIQGFGWKSKSLLLITILISFSMLTDFAVSKVVINENVINPTFGPLYFIYLIYILCGFIYAIHLLYRKYKSSIGVDRIRIRYLFVGFLLFAIIPILTNILLVILNFTSFVVFGPLSVLILDSFIVYTILKHRFLGIRFVIGKVLLAIITIAIPYISYYTIYSIQFYLFDGPFSPVSIIVGILFSIFFVIVFHYTTLIIKEIINSKIISVDFNSTKEFESFSQRISKILDIKDLGNTFVDEINRCFNPKLQSLYLIDKEKGNYCYYKYGNIEYDQSFSEQIIELARISNNNVHTYEDIYDIFIKNSSNRKIRTLLKTIEEKNIKIISIFSDNEGVIGYHIATEKTDQEAYLINDIEFIEKLISNFSIAIQRATLYLETQRFTDTLQKKIDEATSKLQYQKTKLEEKYQFEKDMLGIMGHELRTPMTVARGMTELLLSKIDNKSHLDKNYLKEKLERILGSIIKETNLIQTMLSTSHIDNNKVNLQLTEFDLIETIDFAMMSFKKDADLKNLKLTFVHPDEKLPHMLNDQSRVQEIVNNLISNAIKYTNQGYVTVSVKKVNDFIEYSVKDSGIGIPQSEINNIGRKFYRIHQHLDKKKDVVRAGGTGLGLYVVKGLLEAMGGELRVESEEGKGSTFTAVFPIEVKENDRLILSSSGSDTNDMFEKLGFKKK